MKRFSGRFPTFFDWQRQAGSSLYAKRISRLHYQYPNATLSQLRGIEKITGSRIPIHLVDPRGLLPQERFDRNESIYALNRIRHGDDPLDVLSNISISKFTLQKHLGNYIKIKGDSIKASKTDRIPREMFITENGRDIPIIVSGYKVASIIGKYQNAKRDYIQSGDSSKLRKFVKIRIKDVDGNIHRFETNPRKILEIEESKEAPESYEIYKS